MRLSFGQSATVGNVMACWDVTGTTCSSRPSVGTAFRRLPTAEELFANDPLDERGDPEPQGRDQQQRQLRPLGGGHACSAWRPAALGGGGLHRDITNLIDLDPGFDPVTLQNLFSNVPGPQGARR